LRAVGKMIFAIAADIDKICDALSENEVDLYTLKGYCIDIQ